MRIIVPHVLSKVKDCFIGVVLIQWGARAEGSLDRDIIHVMMDFLHLRRRGDFIIIGEGNHEAFLANITPGHV